MLDSDQTDKDFDSLPPSENSEEKSHFETELPETPRKERRHAFSADYVPKREFSTKRTIKKTGASSDPQVAPEPKNKPVPPKSFWYFKAPVNASFEKLRFGALLAVFIPLTLYAFWPSWESIFHAWSTQLDYGHGFFVIPLVALFLYLRWDDYPGTYPKLTWIGLLPILVCFIMRFNAASKYMDTLDQWAILLWILGVVWFFYGSRVFLWALPSLSYLVFMFQLPWRYEVYMRHHLQQFAAQAAAVLLQMLGQPAIAIKNTIRLSTEELAVETACSGIRFLISILAIAFAAILLMRRSWWQNILVILIAPPLALFVNAARIAMTGILIVNFPGFLQSITPQGQSSSVFADEIAGITMIFVAIAIFFTFLWYLGRVFRKVEI